MPDLMMNTVERGEGRPLVLIHGLGSSWATWLPVLPALTAQRRVIALDLPGFGATAPLPGRVTMDTLTDAVTRFLAERDLADADIVGSSMGARLALELARRGHAGSVVALAPGGFWTEGQRIAFGATIRASVALVRTIQPVIPALANSRPGRSLLLAQFSDHPWALDPRLVLTELRGFSTSPSLDEALDALATGPSQAGAATTAARVSIGWGRQDRVTLPSQASTALERFPGAQFRGFHHCGHFPHWDQPEQATRFILDSTG